MKQLAYFLGWVWGWVWIAVGAGLLLWFFIGNGTGLLAFLAGLGLIVASGLIATISATVRGQFREAKKRCPYCKEVVLADAIKCKHCGSDIGQHERLARLKAQMRDTNSYDRSETIRELEKLGEVGVPLIIEALRDTSDWMAQGQAAVALGNLRDPRGFRPLVNALESKNNMVVETAVRSLGELGDTRAVPYLIAAIQDNPSFMGVADSLAQLADPSALPSLINFMLHTSSSMGEYTARQAIQSFGSQAIPALTEAYKTASQFQRDTIARTLSQIGPSAIPALIELVKSEDHDISFPAWMWLASMNEPARQVLRQEIEHAEGVEKRRMQMMLEDIERISTSEADSSESTPL